MVFMQPPWLFCLFSPRWSCPPASHPTLTFGTQAVSTRELPLLALIKRLVPVPAPRARHPYIITRPPSFPTPADPPTFSVYLFIHPTHFPSPPTSWLHFSTCDPLHRILSPGPLLAAGNYHQGSRHFTLSVSWTSNPCLTGPKATTCTACQEYHDPRNWDVHMSL